MNSATIIKVEHLDKTFKLPHEKYTSLKSILINFYKRNKTYEVQEALKDVSFEIKKGEFFGIVGRNGSGKSTLLKMLAGIYSPTNGSIITAGSLTPFIELGVGFNPELTGRENVYLNGALLGFSRSEIKQMYYDIVEFAEIEKFMDQKLKNYSSGMQVRLAFSIAIRAKSDILVLDEVLAVGDENFQKKCISTFRQIKNSGTTVVFVSHDMSTVEQFCDRVMLIEKGRILMIGNGPEIAQHYRELNQGNSIKAVGTDPRAKVIDAEGLGWVSIETQVLSLEGKPIKMLKQTEKIIIESVITAKQDIRNSFYSFTFEDMEGRTICLFSTYDQNKQLFSMKAHHTKIIRTIVDNVFNEGSYYIDPEVSTLGREVIYGHVDNACYFEIRVQEKNPWLLRPGYRIEIEPSGEKRLS